MKDYTIMGYKSIDIMDNRPIINVPYIPKIFNNKGDYTMNTMMFDKEELLDVIKKNHIAHRDFFLDAQKGYRKRIIQELDSMLADAKSGKNIRISIELPKPVDHTKDYKRIIKMLEMTSEVDIELSDHEFDKYIMDNWEWKEHAFLANSQYSSKWE